MIKLVRDIANILSIDITELKSPVKILQDIKIKVQELVDQANSE